MTIESAIRRPPAVRPRMAKPAGFALQLLAVLAIWFSALAVLALLLPQPASVVAFGADPATLARAGDAQLLRSGRFFLVARTDGGGVQALYKSGAFFVIPIPTTPCLPRAG